MDLTEGLARPLPLAVICELRGLPEEDRPASRRWVKARMSVTSVRGVFRLVPGLFRLGRCFKRRFAHGRHHPRPGRVTALVQAERALLAAPEPTAWLLGDWSLGPPAVAGLLRSVYPEWGSLFSRPARTFRTRPIGMGRTTGCDRA